jgi:uncharacterized protein YbjT (DUF2867 family)
MALDLLLRKKIPVRALVRVDDFRAAMLRRSGAEVVIANYFSLNELRAALDGIRTAYFAYPTAPGVVDATSRFVFAAREAGVRSLINMSQISARRSAGSVAALDQFTAERVVEWSGIGFTHLHPTYSAEYIIRAPALRQIVNYGQIRLPFDDGCHAPIAVEDQARLVAALLENPQPHHGKTYGLHGPLQLRQEEIAHAVGEVLGRRVRYARISLEQYHQELKEEGLSAFQIAHLIHCAQDYQRGVYEGEDGIIGQLTGQAPLTVQEFIHKHKGTFDNVWHDAELTGGNAAPRHLH